MSAEDSGAPWEGRGVATCSPGGAFRAGHTDGDLYELKTMHMLCM